MPATTTISLQLYLFRCNGADTRRYGNMPMITFDQERPQDLAGVETLHDVAFGPERFKKPSDILRKNNPALSNLSRVVWAEGQVVATVRFTPVHIRDPLRGRHVNALLLGPLAVHPMMQAAGLGSELMRQALSAVDRVGDDPVILVGDVGYYGRFGFVPILPRLIMMPKGTASRLLVRQCGARRSLPIIGTVRPGWSHAHDLRPEYLPFA